MKFPEKLKKSTRKTYTEISKQNIEDWMRYELQKEIIFNCMH